MAFSAEQNKQLSAKLDQSHVKPPSANGPKGDYLEGWLVIAEANRIFGFDGWSYEIVTLTQCHEPIKNAKDNYGVSYLARVRVSAGDATREDVGYGSGWSKQLGDAYESATKESVTDALKRCLRTFGNPFGLALYDKSRENVANADDIARDSAIESLWLEFTEIKSPQGFKSFWADNKAAVQKMDDANFNRFMAKHKEFVARFSPKPDLVQQIKSEFPGSRVVRDEDMFPGDTDITDRSGRHMNAMEA